MLCTAVTGAGQHAFMALEQGPLFPATWQFFVYLLVVFWLFVFFFPLVLMGGGPALLLELRGSSHRLLVGFERESITLMGKRAGYCPAVEDASFAAAPAPTASLAFSPWLLQTPESKQNRSGVVGRIFQGEATRSRFSTS